MSTGLLRLGAQGGRNMHLTFEGKTPTERSCSYSRHEAQLKSMCREERTKDEEEELTCPEQNLGFGCW